MTTLDLQAIEERWNQTTPGDWKPRSVTKTLLDAQVANPLTPEQAALDADFIAAAHNDDIPALLEEVKRQAAEIEKLRGALAFYANPFNRKGESGDPVRVPDFYDELCFGDRARTTLNPGAEG